MPPYLIPLEAEAASDPARVGAKAANLNRLLLAGFPVPPGFCITVEAFQAALAPFSHQLQELIAGRDLTDPAAARQAAGEINRLLSGLRLPAALQQELAGALAALGDGPLAVRSSATLEDLAERSFAGQYLTTLGVQGEAAIEGAILDGWRSFYSPHALAARHRAGGPGAADPGMGVLIQPLVNAECAGVCFSVDPLRLRPDLLLVVAGWGLGSGVVSGETPTDTARLRRFDLGLEELVVADKTECRRVAENGRVQRAAVPPAKRGAACLPEDWLQKVGQFGLACEQRLGQPQDVEWAVADGQVWILQSRPITTLPADLIEAARFPVVWEDDADARRFWWFEGIDPRAGGALLPAELAFVKHRSFGGWDAVAYAGGSYTRYRKYVNGRVYMTADASPVSPGDRRIRQAAHQDLHERLQGQGISLWEYWGPEIERATRRLDAFAGNNADGNALADHLEDALAAAKRHWMVHTFIPRQGRLKPLIEAYRQIAGGEQPDVEVTLIYLLQGAETVQTRLVEALYDLACLARQAPAVAAEVAGHTAGAYERMQHLPEAAGFVAQFERLLATYGGRICQWKTAGSPFELPLPWREAPEYVLGLVASYLPAAGAHEMPGPRQARQLAASQVQARVEALCTASDPAAARVFRQGLAFARRNATWTDEHNHYIDQLAEGQYAQALVYAGRWLTQRGDLGCMEEVFWLQPDEVLAALRSPEQEDFSAAIASRQEQFEAWNRLYAPAILGLPDPSLPPRPVISKPATATTGPEATAGRAAQERLLIGQSASRGQGSGPARLAPAGPGLPEVAPGEVLVAVNAGPEWTPLLPALAGIVLDGGSIGDHSAITAREFGVPAVFATGNASRRIPAGAWVRVDGESGRVQWE